MRMKRNDESKIKKERKRSQQIKYETIKMKGRKKEIKKLQGKRIL